MHSSAKPAALGSASASAPASAADRELLLSSALLGFGLLLTYNFLLNLIPFYEAVLAWPDVSYYVALSLTYPSLAVQFVMLTVGERAPAWLRIRAALLANAHALTLVVVAASAAAPQRALVLLLLACSGVATAVLEASIFGFLSQLGHGGACAQAAMAGAGAAGVAACVLQMILSAALPVAAAAAAYAAIGVAVLLACVFAHWRLLQRLPPPQQQQQQQQQQQHQEPKQLDDYANPTGEAPFVSTISPMAEAPVAVLLASAAAAQSAPGQPAGSEPWRASPSSAAAVWARNMARAGRGVALPAAAMFTQFVATFLVFPGLTAAIPFRGAPGALAAPWFSVLLLVFSISDVVGRTVAGLHAAPGAPALLGYALARFLWTPIIAGCALSWRGFGDDAAAVFAMVGFGFTNGHVATLAMMSSASARLAERDKELAGSVFFARRPPASCTRSLAHPEPRPAPPAQVPARGVSTRGHCRRKQSRTGLRGGDVR